MKSSTLIKIASQSILKNKMRTLLTMLGIVIGVGAVIVMVAIGSGAQATIQQQISSLGTNLIIVMPGSSQQGGVNQGAGSVTRLTVQDAEKLKREATELSGVTPVISTRTQVIGNGSNWRTQINGVSADYPTIRDWNTSSGAFFSEQDLRSDRKVAIVGATIVKNLFDGTDPVGQQIQIGKQPFTIVGVMEAKGQNAMGGDQDDIVLVPYTTAQTRLSGSLRIGQILASANSQSDMAAAQEDMGTIMRESHRIAEGDPDDFTIRNQTDIATAAQGTTKVMTMLLAAIASVSLLVGGIGIMNIMLVSVTERTREIGIRMAIGGRGSDVLTQFLVESVVMSLIGGLIGVVAGVGGAKLVTLVTGWSASTPISAVIGAVGFSALVGVFFGFYPARKAAALNPIQALRYE
jgi:putative ABC transport system permease protein